MNRVYRQLLLALLSIISLAITCNKCQQRKQARKAGALSSDQQMLDVFYIYKQEGLPLMKRKKTIFQNAASLK